MSKLSRIGSTGTSQFICIKTVDYYNTYYTPTYAGKIHPGEIITGQKVLNAGAQKNIPLGFYFYRGGKQYLVMFDSPEKFSNYFKPRFSQKSLHKNRYQVGDVPEEVDGYPTVMKEKIINLGDKPIDEMTEGELDLYLARERLKAERDAMAKIRGIGSVKTQGYQDAIDSIQDAIDSIDGPDSEDHMDRIDDHIQEGRYSNAHRLAGIGNSGTISERRAYWAEERRKDREAYIGRRKKKGRLKQALKKAGKKIKKAATKTGKFIKKAAQKTGKALKKIATAPARLAAKAILEVTLPKAAPFFLYLFINDPALIAKLPPKARNKRKKAERYADFIVNGIGMKRNHFMAIVRTGIIKQTGKSPESIIAAQIQGKKLSGIGALGMSAAIPALLEIIRKLISIFKRKKPAEDVSEDDAPSDDDFEAMDEDDSKELASDVKKQTDRQDFNRNAIDHEGGGGGGGSAKDDDNETGGRRVWRSFGN